ncbi:MAG: amidohydrolase family protein [Hyphomicrobiaceae bacterium]|nr:amidohydrolase family protein [Hyphomicrobiaceae bacterium]
MDAEKDQPNLLITGATVVTLDVERNIISDGAIAIAGDRIAAVGLSDELRQRFPNAEILDARGKAVLPGFINSHTHAVLLVLRGTVEDMSGDAIFGYMTPISFAMNDDERRALARLACLEAIRCGTTTMVEPFRFITGYAAGMAETGMRLWLSENGADALTLKIRHGIYEYDRAFGEEFLDRVRAMVDQFHDTHDGRVKCQMAAHAPDVCSPWMLGELNDLARKHGLTRTIHLAQSPGEVKQVRAAHDRTSAEYLRDNDWLGPDVVAAHWTFCTDDDIDLLAEHGVHMAHCPANSSRRGPHLARVGRIQDAGVNIVLGTDNMTEDMFQALKIGSIIHRGRRGSEQEGGVNPGPQAVLDSATRNAAHALRAEADIGSLEAGKKADLMILDLNQPNLRPIINLVSNIVHYGSSSAVESVMVDGRFVMRDGKVLSMNEDEVIAEAQEATAAAWHRLKETSGDIDLPAGLQRERAQP